MNVLLLGPYPPPHGGVQTNLVAIRQYLLKRNIPCAVINLTRFRQASANDIYFPENVPQLLRLLAKLRYDVIHLHFGGDLNRRLLGLSLICSLIPRAKVVLTFHSGGYPASPQGQAAVRGSFPGFVLRRLDCLIGVNEELVSFFQKLGVPPSRTRLICPFSGSVEPDPGPLPDRLARFQQSHQPFLVTVSGLEPEYDLPLQIEVLGSIRQTYPQAGLAIFGAGSLEQELRAKIQSKSYAEHILLYGDLPHGATLRAVAESDVFLRTTWYDGDAISVREALQLGTPVIASDNGMRPAGVHLIPPANAEALRDAILRVLAQPVARYPREQDESNLEAVLELYRELLRSR